MNWLPELGGQKNNGESSSDMLRHNMVLHSHPLRLVGGAYLGPAALPGLPLRCLLQLRPDCHGVSCERRQTALPRLNVHDRGEVIQKGGHRMLLQLLSVPVQHGGNILRVKREMDIHEDTP